MVEQTYKVLHFVEANNGKTYFVQALFGEDFSCSAVITDTVKTWKTYIDNATVAKFADEASTDLNEYYLLLKSALSGMPISEKFHYIVCEETDQKLVLEWKKVQDDVKFSLGTIAFNHSGDSSDSLQNMLITTVQSFKLLFSALNDSKKACKELEKAHKSLQVDFKQCADLKDTLQTELMSKFVLVINEKKNKIRALNEQLLLRSSNDVSSKSKEISSTPKVIVSSKCKAIRIYSDEDIDEPILPKRQRKATKYPVDVSVSPVKSKELTSATPVKFSSDVNTTTSSDSTVDVNELLEDI